MKYDLRNSINVNQKKCGGMPIEFFDVTSEHFVHNDELFVTNQKKNVYSRMKWFELFVVCT